MLRVRKKKRVKKKLLPPRSPEEADYCTLMRKMSPGNGEDTRGCLPRSTVAAEGAEGESGP